MITKNKNNILNNNNKLIYIIIVLVIINIIISIFIYKKEEIEITNLCNTNTNQKEISSQEETIDNYIDNDLIDFDDKEKINIDDFFRAKSIDDIKSSKYSNVRGLENIEDLNDGSFKINYPAGSYKPSVQPRGGAGFLYKLDTPREKAKLSYKIKFDKDFEFVKGGKLPGFCGGGCPRGGYEDEYGFSTRYMWRENGKIELYTYLPHDNSPLGIGLGKGSFTFEKDKFYTISQELKLNDVGKANGILTLMVDGKRIYQKENVIYRDSEEVLIDTLLFSTFFGGGDESFATPVDTYIVIKDFEVDY